MKTEYEVRFLEVDENEILRNLKKSWSRRNWKLATN